MILFIIIIKIEVFFKSISYTRPTIFKSKQVTLTTSFINVDNCSNSFKTFHLPSVKKFNALF